MGAWIETFQLPAVTLGVLRSHPTWVRGLKLGEEDSFLGQATNVAPYMGAWIETNTISGYEGITASHPTWVRGLKQVR